MIQSLLLCILVLIYTTRGVCRQEISEATLIIKSHHARTINHHTKHTHTHEQHYTITKIEIKNTSQVMTSSPRAPPPPLTLAGATLGAGEAQREKNLFTNLEVCVKQVLKILQIHSFEDSDHSCFSRSS